MTYTYVLFEEADDDYITQEVLTAFLIDADIVIGNYGKAWSKEEITKVGDSLRGATIELKDSGFTYGYNVHAKLVVNKRE